MKINDSTHTHTCVATSAAVGGCQQLKSVELSGSTDLFDLLPQWRTLPVGALPLQSAFLSPWAPAHAIVTGAAASSLAHVSPQQQTKLSTETEPPNSAFHWRKSPRKYGEKREVLHKSKEGFFPK